MEFVYSVHIVGSKRVGGRALMRLGLTTEDGSVSG